VTPEGSTHVDTAFTGTTSSISRTATGKVAVVAVARQRVFWLGGRMPRSLTWAHLRTPKVESLTWHARPLRARRRSTRLVDLGGAVQALTCPCARC
jgi:hypothetical protein